jgi:SAM-dependent MidA family methyltransferase
MQAEKLPGATWHERLETLPEGPFVLLANEFLDALPIRQFVRREAGWAERFVEDGKFVERPHSDPPPPLAGGGWGEGAVVEYGEAAVVEYGEAALAFTVAIGKRLTAHPGASLLLDYGPEHSAAGESLQALRNGKRAEPLSDPGSADLTAHVDFAAVAAAARDAGADTHGPIPQGIFLTRLGLFQRTDRLARSQSPARASALIEAARRLAEPNRMGRLFKALAVCGGGQPTPPGFE